MNEQAGITKQLYQSPVRLVIVFVTIILLADLLTGLLLRLLPPFPVLTLALIDSILLVFILAPVVYLLVFHPMIKHIAERNLAEAALRESEEKYKSLFEEDLTGDFLMTGEGFIIDCNLSFLEMFGYSNKKEVVGKNVMMIYEDISEFERIKKQLLIHKKLTNYETVRKRKNGKLINTIENKIAGFSLQGEITEIKGYIYDVTERKLAEEALKESETRLRELNATKDKFFSIIAHDLKSPFNSIIGFSNLLVEQVREKDYKGIEEYAGIIQSSSQRVMDLLMNLLEWSRSQTGRMEFNPEHLEIVSIINNVTELLENASQQKSITISLELPHDILAYADKDMISLVLRNLVSNAIKFTNPGGQIVISAGINQNELMISVSDTGVGMTADTIKRLFRIEENYSTAGTINELGTGLGLILCKEFVEKHGGKIWAESAAGKGSSFHFTIPK